MTRRPIPVAVKPEPSCPPSCGACCYPVVLPYSKLDIISLGPQIDDDTRRWVLEDLTPLSRREGLRRAPYLAQGGTTMAIIAGRPTLAYSVFYECRHFDPDTKKCGIYDDRPDACREYPLYGEAVLDPAKAVPAECVYRQ